jgi:hypothetical protein
MSKPLSRRKFISHTALTAMGVGAIAALPVYASAQGKQSLMHLVLYYMKDNEQPGDRQKLVNGLKELVTVKQIRYSHIGFPQEFKAEDPQKNWHVSLLMCFDDKGDIDIYHKDPIHQKFVKEYGMLWGKTIKFDSLGV